MPQTFFGLVFLAVLLLPGLMYRVVVEARRPSAQISTFRESASVAFAGLVSDLIAVAVFAAIRWRLPAHSPDLGALFRNPTGYLKIEYAYVFWWAMATLAVACVVAAGLAFVRVGLGPFFTASAWTEIFGLAEAKKKRREKKKKKKKKKKYTYCSCVLEDGTWIGGYLESYSGVVEETQDRDVVLQAPIKYRNAGDEEETLLGDQYLIVSARRLATIGVTILPEEAFETDMKAFEEFQGGSPPSQHPPENRQSPDAEEPST